MNARPKIWDLLVESGLVAPSQAGEIRTEFEGDASPESRSDPDSVLRWLKDRKRISGFQMQVLAGGLPGPFKFDQYRIHALDSAGPMAGSYRGRHSSSDHPVRLCFLGGSSLPDAKKWAGIKSHSSPLHAIDCPFISRFYELVESGEYRFAVFEERAGKTLLEKLPYKGRLPWPQTCQAVEQLATGLSEIHKAGLSHGRIWPGAVWLLRSGHCQLLWQIPNLHFDPDPGNEKNTLPNSFQAPRVDHGPVDSDIADEQRRDLYSLGALVFRLVSGKEPKIKSCDPDRRKLEIDKHMALCQKYSVPDNVQQLIRLLLAADISDSPKDAEVTAKLIGSILGSQSIANDVDAPPESLTPYLQTIDQKTRSMRFVDELESIDGTSLSSSAGAGESGIPDFTNLSIGESTVSVRDRVQKRKTGSRSKRPAVIAGTILATAIVAGVLLNGLFSGSEPSAHSDPSSDRLGEAQEKPELNAEGESDTVDPGSSSPDVQPVTFRPQNIIENNSELPWESPTGSEPIDVRFVPAAPELIFTFRPRRMTEQESETRFLRSLGPRFAELQTRFSTVSGLRTDEIERMVVSLHNNGQGSFHTVVSVELAEPIDRDTYLERIGNPQLVNHSESGITYLEIGENVIGYEPEPGDLVNLLVIGPTDLVLDSFDSSGLAMAGSTMSRLIERSDRDRDLNILFRNAALLSEEGTWLFSGEFAALRRPLQLFFDDRMQGAKLSLHFDNGCYLELMTEQSQDLSDKELVEELPTRFRNARDELTHYVSTIPSHPYWSSVQQKLDNMLNELVRNIRVGRERDGVTSNCWLPVAAPHNLIAAGELVLNANALAGGSTVMKFGPSSLEELLRTPRDLSVTSDPDLVNLLREIEQEIRDDFPDLPFDFRIRLLGKDLSEMGITQNQRPGRVEAQQKPLGDILAQIMLQANPDKNATGPSDEACMLVWLTGPDPDDPDTTAVLVTTRSAAATRNWTLPSMFQPE